MTMTERDRVIQGIQECNLNGGRIGNCPYKGIIDLLKEQEDLGTELVNAVEMIHKKNERIEKLLKEQEYKEKMYHALADDWKALVKEKEPVKPTWNQGKAYCGKCGQKLPRKRADREINYCGYCGQKVKWND